MPQPSANIFQQPRILKLFQTARNLFGVSRQYYSDKLPTRDPDQLLSLVDICHDAIDLGTPECNLPHDSPHLSSQSFYPYPNQSSFQLGNWFWNGGEKSQESFKELLKIVSDPMFQPSDVRHTQWNTIDAALASNELGDEDKWADIDAGWIRKPISFS
jgi:hypothetical protein